MNALRVNRLSLFLSLRRLMRLIKFKDDEYPAVQELLAATHNAQAV